MNIKFFYDDIGFRIKGTGKIRALIEKIIAVNGRKIGEINYIITSGAKLLDINKEYLKHDYYTDVITFNYNDSVFVNGEIYISYDDVKSNSMIYKEDFAGEMLRVIIHGVLHLCGYNDKSDPERRLMKMEEDRWLKYFQNEIK